jgi:folylpolyglutamate synthase/dihydropteroate synthase
VDALVYNAHREAVLADAASLLESGPLTSFELLAMTAVHIFHDLVDVAVIEVGMGSCRDQSLDGHFDMCV